VKFTSLYLLDLYAFHKSLDPRPHLADGGGDIIRPVDREHRKAVIITQHGGTEEPFISPGIAEFDLLIDDAVRVILAREIRHVLLPAVHLFHVHHARALAHVCVVTAYLRQGVLVLRQRDRFAAREGAEAEAVRAHIGAALLDELDEAAVVDFGARHENAGAPRSVVRLAGFQLFQRLFQFVFDEIFGTDVGRQRENMEFIACDAGMLFFAEFRQ